MSIGLTQAWIKGKLEIEGNSTSETNPNFLIKENEDDFARMSFGQTGQANVWTLAGKSAANSKDAEFHLTYSENMSSMLIANGNGNIMIGTANDVVDVWNVGYPEVSKFTVKSHSRIAGYFETDTVDILYDGLLTSALVGKYTGDKNKNASGVIGYSSPDVQNGGGYGIGGYFIGGGRGICAYAEGGDDIDDNYNAKSGIYTGALGNGNTIKYGIYAYTSGVGTTYAGYFTGNVHITGTLTNPSDKKLKENIANFDGALAKLMKVKTYTYTYKTEDEEAKLMNLAKGKQIGFVSQELEEIFPNLVKDEVNVVELRDERGMPTQKSKTIKYKGVNYIGMVPVLTKAIQEQQVIIEEQKATIENLQSQIDNLYLKLGIQK
jgi:hypothetical protein